MLPAQALKFPPALLRSFLALTIRFSDDDFYRGRRSAAVEFYKTSASDMLFKQVAEPTGSLDVLRAFCLLCLSEIEGLFEPLLLKETMN